MRSNTPPLPPLRSASAPPCVSDTLVADDDFGEGECDCIHHGPSSSPDEWWEAVPSCPIHGDASL